MNKYPIKGEACEKINTRIEEKFSLRKLTQKFPDLN